MSFLTDITPSNLLEEKSKFLADNSYEPQLQYQGEIDQARLIKYGRPKKPWLELAEEIVTRSYSGRNEADLNMMRGPQLTQREVEQKVHSFLTLHHLEKRFDLIWSSSYVARTTITTDTIKLRLPVDFRRDDLLGMIYHEIGTHALRRINYEKQSWYKKKKRFGLNTNYLRTEEGLAVLHTLLPQRFKMAHPTALRYLAIEFALHHSFAQTWHWLAKYIHDQEKRWLICLRLKRGLTDTSQPGCHTKDLVYFEGLIEVYKYLKQHDFNLRPLYLGKVALADVAKAQELSGDFQPQLPSFYTLNPVQYAAGLKEIAQLNHLPD